MADHHPHHHRHRHHHQDDDATRRHRPSARSVPLRDPAEEAWIMQQDAAARLYHASASAVIMPFRDPFETAAAREVAAEADERSAKGLGLGFGTCASPPLLPPLVRPSDSDVATSFVSVAGDCDGDGGGDEEGVEVQFEFDGEVRRRERAAEVARIQELMSNFTEEQLRRYGACRSSKFHKSKIRKLLTALLGNNNFSEEINIVVSALAKLFVGDLVETARVIMTEKKHSGPIRPSHIRESCRRLKLKGKAFRRTVPRLFH